MLSADNGNYRKPSEAPAFKERMRHGSLFSGIGGFDLAASWCGWQNVWQIEIDPYCRAVLQKHFPDTKRYEDIKNVKGTELEAVDVISGGFPCQPFSVAGKQAGKTDNRYLWPEMLRVITEVKPTWVVAENVAGIINMELESVLASLEAEGYEVWPIVIPACAVGAPHRRDRVWILGHSKHNGLATTKVRESDNTRDDSIESWQKQASEFTRSDILENAECIRSGRRNETRGEILEREGSKIEATGSRSEPEDVADANITRPQGHRKFRECSSERFAWQSCQANLCDTTIEGLSDWFGGEVGRPWPLTEFERPNGREVERDFRGVSYGVSNRVHRLKSLGNAIVPQIAYQIFKAIDEIDSEVPAKI